MKTRGVVGLNRRKLGLYKIKKGHEGQKSLVSKEVIGIDEGFRIKTR